MSSNETATWYFVLFRKQRMEEDLGAYSDRELWRRPARLYPESL